MIPKIEFRYSWIYDTKFRESKKINEFLKSIGKEYPSEKDIRSFIKRVEKIWNKNGNEIVSEISAITGLKWKEEKIICYIVGCCIPYSDPLTIGIYEKPQRFIEILSHELIHQNQSVVHFKKWNRWFAHAQIKYLSSDRTTIAHIFLHAVLKKLYLKFFSKKRLHDEMQFNRKFEGYKLAWEIVEREGSENIIKEFKEITK